MLVVSAAKILRPRLVVECKQCKRVQAGHLHKQSALILNQLLIPSLLIDMANSSTFEDPLTSFTVWLHVLDLEQSVTEHLDDPSSDQTSQASTARNIEDLPRVTINGKEYIHTSLLTSKYTQHQTATARDEY